ncbi:hypothetical protein ACMWPQ_29735, partial [Escherichia coli]
MSLALQAGMYATPILYPSSSVPAQFKFVLVLNPLAGIVDDFRRILLDGKSPDWVQFAGYASVSFLICFLGLY